MAETHEVQQGDTLISIAHQYGFRNWLTIWNHDQNEALRAKRDNPQILAPGDAVHIPDKAPREDECETNQWHTFTLPRLQAYVRLTMADANGEPYANKRYKLTVGEEAFEGETAANGLLEQAVPPDAKKAELLFWADPAKPPLKYTLDLGRLDPIDTDTGVQARLNSLGYHSGDVDGELDDAFADALRNFQEDHDLPLTGTIDEDTRGKLRELARRAV